MVECVAVMRKKKQAARIGLSNSRHRPDMADSSQEIRSSSSFRSSDRSVQRHPAVQVWVSQTRCDVETFDTQSWSEHGRKSRGRTVASSNLTTMLVY